MFGGAGKGDGRKEGDSGIRHMTDVLSIASEACLDLWQGVSCGVWPPKLCAHWSIYYLTPPSQMDGPQLLWESMRALHEESWCLLPTNCCFPTVMENVSFQTQPVIGEGVHLIRNRSFGKSSVVPIRNYSPKSYINPVWRGTTIQASRVFFSPWEMICNTLPLQLFQPALVQ